MNDLQQKAAVAGFVQALAESEEARNKWLSYFQAQDWVGLRLFIQETLGLAYTPSPEDLDAMRAYANVYTAASPSTLHEGDERIPATYVFDGAQFPPIPWPPVLVAPGEVRV